MSPRQLENYERVVERRLVTLVEEAGGLAYKFKSPGRRGVPDRIAVFPGNRIFFIELKAPGKTAQSHQVREHRRLRQRGCEVLVLSSIEEVDAWVLVNKP